MIKHIIFVAFLLGVVSSVRAQHFPNDGENETMIAQGKMPARATSYSYPSVDDALTGDRDRARLVSLGGDWKFHFEPDSRSRPTDFFKTGFDASDWDTLPVPSSWEVNGYGTPIYVNSTYPFTADPPRIDRTNPVGSYLRELVERDKNHPSVISWSLGNFCLNGIIASDRTPKPQAWECKYVFQPVAFEEVNLNAGRVRLVNRFHFNNIDQYEIRWQLSENGTPLAEGKLPIGKQVSLSAINWAARGPGRTTATAVVARRSVRSRQP